jgi:hypothetical protein
MWLFIIFFGTIIVRESFGNMPDGNCEFKFQAGGQFKSVNRVIVITEDHHPQGLSDCWINHCVTWNRFVNSKYYSDWSCNFENGCDVSKMAKCLSFSLRRSNVFFRATVLIRKTSLYYNLYMVILPKVSPTSHVLIVA